MIQGYKENKKDNTCFFGLHDKNGIQIWTGDYIKRHNYLYQVFWNKQEFSFQLKIIARKNDFAENWIKSDIDKNRKQNYILQYDKINEVIISPTVV